MALSTKLKKFINQHMDSDSEESIEIIVKDFVNRSIKGKELIIDYLLEEHQADWIIDSLDNLAEQDEFGNTLLHYAINNNHEKVVNLILKTDNIPEVIKQNYIALTEIRNEEDETPLDFLTKYSNPLIIEDLEEYCFQYKAQKKIELLLAQQLKITPSKSFVPTYRQQHLESVSYSKTETIISKQQTGMTPQWADAACFPEYNWLSKSTGQIVWKDLSDSSDLEQNVSRERWGSGCLISKNWFLTAGHCFDPLDGKDWVLFHASTGKTLKSIEFIPLMTVNFSYQLATCPLSGSKHKQSSITGEKKFNIKRLVEYRQGGLDYAILELEGAPGDEFGKVNLSTDLPNAGEEVVIAQHPNGEVKKVHYGPALCKTASCGVDDGKIYYEVDTEPGSSGSPVALTTKKTVIGVHTTGFNETEFQANSAVSILAIKQVSKVLNSSKFGFFPSSPDSEKKTRGGTQENRQTEFYKSY